MNSIFQGRINGVGIRSILQLERSAFFILLFYPLVYLGVAFAESVKTWPLSNPLQPLLGIFVVMIAAFLFTGERAWGVNPRFQSPGLEFFFSLPVSRLEVFLIKTGIYFLGCVLGPLIMLCSSVFQPEVTIFVPPWKSDRKEMVSFYTESFKGAHLEKVRDGDVIVLPHGNVDYRIYILFVVLLLASIVQAVAVFTMTKRWGNIVLFSIMFLWQIGVAKFFYQAGFPSFHDEIITFIAKHLGHSFLALGIFVAGVQLICARRFCGTELV